LGDDLPPYFGYPKNVFVLEVDMATFTQTYISRPVFIVFVRRGDKWVKKHVPRHCMLFPAGLILAGLSIPALMVFGLLPATMLLGFVGLALAATGGLLSIVRCGEM
jgi:O-antigen/teichoic acid export membrane protein